MEIRPVHRDDEEIERQICCRKRLRRRAPFD